MARAKVLHKRVEACLAKGRLGEAARLLEQLCRQESADGALWRRLGEIRLALGKPAEALQSFGRCLALKKDEASALAGAAEALWRLGRQDEARRHAEQSLNLDPRQGRAAFVLGEVAREKGGFDSAERYYRQAIQTGAKEGGVHYLHGNMLKLQGRVDEAVAAYEQALAADPQRVEAFWERQRLLPVILDAEEEIARYREDYRQGLRRLEESLDLKSTSGRRAALRGALSSTNFYLQYQGCDDLPLQEQYGRILEKVAAANFPQWGAGREMAPRKGGGRIRIGYASAFLRAHNGAVWLLGWLRHRNRERFEIYCYHTGGKVDEKTEEFRHLSDHFHHVPGGVEQACARIAADELDILVYPELGMDAKSMVMAAMRLAPIQCVGWGHPITSGLSTMDYWLSSDLMEPENGQEHYSERLVRLPNMANCYSRDQHDRLQSRGASKSRADFGLPEGAVLYFCSQSLFKYLPQYDWLWPEIARRVPKAKFVFLAISSVQVVKRFMARVERAFARAGLSAGDYCIMLNRQTPEDYLNLNLLMDVFLDNPPWSGNNTGLAAVDAHLPIVTWPTGFMRGRHSCAILKMMGVTETIASSGEEYVEIAARLGLEREWRMEVKERFAASAERIYEDVECVRGLEAFYEEAVSGQS
ncbi:tetratricopeptide repeat protein [Thiohalobacter sp. IOR34]|uniref:O-linked N-acetylglucosamine transferase, SPINDLY family protein n=1 Tax=Thiohalobacter sp. IOR34 TaxID=3057176 RepID=UPI0025B00C35|nr:tetratricopeptide repeat protein [Thiohalobacter sp. IOR34]WJW75198.1 tetratricopeptide repeat protein [Thiohalobacter sp. IOR34]